MKKIDRIKKRFVEDGLDITLNGKKGSRIYKKKAPAGVMLRLGSDHTK